MTAHYLLLAALLVSSLSFEVDAQNQNALSTKFYEKSCPQLHEIVNKVIDHKKKQATPAAILRIFFHDCMVTGCDASVMISKKPHGKPEKEHDINLSLAGDGFEIVMSVKDALELQCPGVVSCADVMALSVRNLLKSVGGPLVDFPLGRRDSLTSDDTAVEGNLARTNFTMDTIIKMFEQKNLNLEEMVALIGGGHSIGFAHCSEIMDRVERFSKDKPSDPAIRADLLQRMKEDCRGYQQDETKAMFLDVYSPGNFDNMIFRNMKKGWAVLATDQRMFEDPRTKPICEKFEKEDHVFEDVFAKAILKVSHFGIKTGNEGEIRKVCDRFNKY